MSICKDKTGEYSVLILKALLYVDNDVFRNDILSLEDMRTSIEVLKLILTLDTII